ncbi:MAG: efflux RND transporter periplasmic adaptor subunit [Myxococcota bacterium]
MHVLIGLVLLAGCSSEEIQETPPLAVQTERVTAEPISDQILTTAVLEAEIWQALYFQQNGIVDRISVTEGDTVRQGQQLSALDLDYQNNQVSLYRVQVRSAELDLAQAQHDLAQARRVEASGGYSPEQVYDKEQRVEEAELNLRKQKLSLQSQLIKRDQMTLVAPFDGLVSEMNVHVGDKIRGDVSDPDNDTNTRPPMVVYQPGRFTARISLPEGQARRISVGDAARISMMEDATVAFDGVVDWIAPAVDRDNRTVAVRITAALQTDDPVYQRVRDGSTARVVLSAATAGVQDVLTVPERAVVYSNDQAYLFLTDGDVAQKVAVTQGRMRSGRVEIQDGLTEGAQIITSQVYTLTDGQPIRLVGGTN